MKLADVILEPNLADLSSGAKSPDIDDERDDEHDDENEIPVRETDESTEAPEEFEVDDEDGFGHPEDDDEDDANGGNGAGALNGAGDSD